MQKIMIIAVLLCSAVGLQAQTTQIERTYSSSDSNVDGEVTVKDIANTTSVILEDNKSTEQSMVKAEEINNILGNIDTKLSDIGVWDSNSYTMEYVSIIGAPYGSDANTCYVNGVSQSKSIHEAIKEYAAQGYSMDKFTVSGNLQHIYMSRITKKE